MNDKMQYVFLEKQFLINKMCLPIDIIYEIKDFLFYDKITGNTRKQKSVLAFVIDSAFYSRKSLKIPDYDGHWVFRAGGKCDRSEMQFQGINCIHCGNYKNTHSHVGIDPPFSSRLDCYCH
jgi:hypothetical protein